MNAPLPLAIIDFEASSLEHDSYPIEVGMAVLDAVGTINTWSTLIRPTTTWELSGHWSHRSQRIHGIAREELGAGLSPRQVMQELNERLALIPRVCCDGGDYDRMWLHSLSRAAGIDPEFELADLDALLAECAIDPAAVGDHLHQSAIPHRAGPDAERLLQAVQAAAAPVSGTIAAL